MTRLAVVITASLLLTPGLCPGQEDVARRHIRSGLARAADGDTAAALREFSQAVDAAPKLAEAHFQLGRLLARYATWNETDSQYRMRAEHALEEAIDLDPDNPLYMSELGMLRIKQQMRNDGERILGRALNMAREQSSGDSTMLADTYYNLAYAKEVRYERQRDQWITFMSMPSISSYLPSRQLLSQYVESYVEGARPLEEAGLPTLYVMLEYYRTALRYSPTHLEASRRLLLHTFEAGELSEYLAVARRLAEAHDHRPEVHLYLGLGLHQSGREEEAGLAFDRGLELMPEYDRIAFTSIEPVLRRRPANAYMALNDSARASFEELYWRVSDPLYLTEANERRLEHLSRVAFADLRYSEPSVGLRGWETDRGTIYIRYGAPELEMRFKEKVVWNYSGGVSFMFRLQAGYFRSRFPGDYQYAAEQYRIAQPAKYDNIPSIPALFPIPVQIARFRGVTADHVAVEVHSELPVESLLQGAEMETSELETGLFLLNANGERIVRQVATEVIDYGDASRANPLRSWRLMLPASSRLVAAVEVRDAVSWLAAASRDTFTSVPFAEDSLAVSDILLAEALRPLAPEPTRRVEYDIVPNPSRTYATNQPITIYYELYGLDRDREGFADFDVSITVRVTSLYRRGAIAQLIGALADTWGFSIAGDDRVELQYHRQVDLTERDRVIEHLTLDLQAAPRVRDLSQDLGSAGGIACQRAAKLCRGGVDYWSRFRQPTGDSRQPTLKFCWTTDDRLPARDARLSAAAAA